LNKSKQETVKIINDLKVDKPDLQPVTINKLNIKSEKWKTKEKNAESIDDDIELDKEKFKKEVNISEKSDSFINKIMNVDVKNMNTDFVEDLKSSSFNYEQLREFAVESITQEFFQSIRTDSVITYPRKIYNTFKKIKSTIICHQLLSEMKINKETIYWIKKNN